MGVGRECGVAGEGRGPAWGVVGYKIGRPRLRGWVEWLRHCWVGWLAGLVRLIGWAGMSIRFKGRNGMASRSTKGMITNWGWGGSE